MAAFRGRGREGALPPITFPKNESTNDKLLVYVVSHVDELEINVPKVSAILGQYVSFKRSPTHGRPGENAFIVEDAHKGSLALATGFGVEGIRFATKNSTPLAKEREEVLRDELDPEVSESDQELLAILSAGTKFGSRRQLDLILCNETVLMDKAIGVHVASWREEVPVITEEDWELLRSMGTVEGTGPSIVPPTSDALPEKDGQPPRSARPTTYDVVREAPLMGKPERLHLSLDWIDEGEESIILHFLKKQTWIKGGQREVCQFGHEYDFASKKVTGQSPIPEEVDALAMNLTTERDPHATPDNVIAIRYTPPFELPPHKDCAVFDDVVHSLGLSSGTVVTFHDGRSKFELAHPPRAMVAMGGHSRSECTHCILPGDHDMVEGERKNREVRYAITFRSVRKTYLPPLPSHDD